MLSRPYSYVVGDLTKIQISQITGYLRGKSVLIIFDRHTNLKYKNENIYFWCRGYYVDTVRKMLKR